MHSQKRKLLSKIKEAGSFGTMLNSNGHTNIPPPSLDAFHAFNDHLINNPVAYKLDNNPLSNTLFDEQLQIIAYLIPKEDILSGRTEELENFFIYITSSREVAKLHMQRIDFSITGYEHDPSELYQIDDVVRYIGKLNKIFPYWLFFQNPNSHWMKILLACLSQGQVKDVKGSKNLVAMKPELITRHANRWFLALNELCHKHAFSETINRKISEDFNNLIKSFAE